VNIFEDMPTKRKSVILPILLLCWVVLTVSTERGEEDEEDFHDDEDYNMDYEDEDYDDNDEFYDGIGDDYEDYDYEHGGEL